MIAQRPWWQWLIGLTAAVLVALAVNHLGAMTAETVVVGLAAAALVGLALLAKGLSDPLILAGIVVAALPIERIVAVHVGGTAVRISEVVGVVGVGAVGLRLLTRQQRAMSFPIGWLLAAYLLVAGVSAVLAVDLPRALQVITFTVVTMSLTWFVVQTVRTDRDLHWLVRAIMLGAAVALAYGAFQYLGDFAGLPPALTGILPGYSKAVLGFPRMQSFMIEPLYFANYLFLPLGLALGLWLEKVDGWRRGRSVLAIVGMVLAIGLTVSRGAYLALVPFLLVLAVVHYRTFFTARVIAVILTLVIGLGAPAAGLLLTSRSPKVQAFVSHATGADVLAGQGESSVGRLLAYQQALDAWRTAPVFGIGPGNFGFYVKGYASRGSFNNLDIVNNEYLEILAETGVVGLLIFVALILTLVGRQLLALGRSRDPSVTAILGGTLAAFAALLVQYNFFSSLYIVYVWVLIGIMLAVQNVAFHRVNHEPEAVSRKEAR